MTGPDPSKLAELQQAHSEGRVLGLKDVAGVCERLDIDVLMTEKPLVFNLFLLALNNLKKKDGPMGYQQIAGIHGFPMKWWDGVKGKITAPPDTRQGFYCPHGIEAFPTWHRPYLAMLEQCLYLEAVSIAQSYDQPHRDKYLAAVQEFRLPYWDYYRPRNGPSNFEFPGVLDETKTSFLYDYSVPSIVLQEKVVLSDKPDNTSSGPVSNPLSHFEFPNDGADIEWNEVINKRSKKIVPLTHKRTVRQPTETSLDGDCDRLSNVLNSLRMDGTRLLLMMLEDDIYADYNTFASSRLPEQRPPPKMPSDIKQDTAPQKQIWANASGSLEALHGTYHVMVGGVVPEIAGHMSQVPVAAFDPIFWLHHGNIERIFTLWQATRAGNGTDWFHKEPFPDYPDPKRGLAPFRKEIGNAEINCWSSNDCKTTDVFGYKFPEAQGTPTEVKKKIDDMYAWSIMRGNPPTIGEITLADMKPRNLSQSPFFEVGKAPKFRDDLKRPEQPSSLVDSSASQARIQSFMMAHRASRLVAAETWDWFVDDKVERLALNGPFAILYFINEAPGSRSLGPISDFVEKPTFAAMTYAFVAPSEVCDNCQKDADQGKIISNTNSITSMLMDYVTIGSLQSLHPDHVQPFLIDRLRWRVVDGAGILRDPRILAREKHLLMNISSKLTSSTGEISYGEYPEVIDTIIHNASATPTAG